MKIGEVSKLFKKKKKKKQKKKRKPSELPVFAHSSGNYHQMRLVIIKHPAVCGWVHAGLKFIY